MRQLAALALALIPASAATAAPAPTYSKDVAPIIQKHCQGCHRAGEIGPMALTNYKEVRPWAKAIRESTLSKRMPPWFADPNHGTWTNDRSLNEAEIKTIQAWVEGGAPEGNPRDLPPARTFPAGWQLGEPDAVLTWKEPFQVPSSGEIDYQFIKVPTGFTEDKWIQSVEFRPGDSAVVHHVVLFIREPDGKQFAKMEYYKPYPSPNSSRRKPKDDDGTGRLEGGQDVLGTYTPGGDWQGWKPGQAKLIKAGSDLVFQMHYTTNGKAAADVTKVGLIFAKEPPKERVITEFVSNRNLRIPPNTPNHRVDARVKLKDDMTIVGFFPHMHARGKAFEYKATYPTGESQTLLKVPHYDFNWQLYYYAEKPIVLPKGTVLECTAIYDNTANKAGNPDPNAEVLWGDQTWEEMLAAFIEYVIPVDGKSERAAR